MAKKAHGWNPDKATIQTLYSVGNMESINKVTATLKLFASEEDAKDTLLIFTLGCSELNEKLPENPFAPAKKVLLTVPIQEAIKHVILESEKAQKELDALVAVARAEREVREKAEKDAKLEEGKAKAAPLPKKSKPADSTSASGPGEVRTAVQ